MSIQEIVQSLVSLNDIHEKLLILGEQKHKVLIKNNVNELTQITNKESRLMKQVTEQEQQWIEHTSKFLTDKGYTPNPSMTMTELVKLVFNAEEKQALQQAQDKLTLTMNKLKEMNALNQQLIEQSLSYIDYTLDLMTGDPNQDMFYKDPSNLSKSNKNKGKGIFDTKA